MPDCAACPSKGTCHRPEKDSAKIHKSIRYVLAVVSGKGGVGKSSVCSLLALQLARLGLRVGILDADLMGPSIPRLVGLEAASVAADGAGHMLPVRSRSGIRIMSINVLLEDPAEPVVYRGPMLAQALKQMWDETAWGDLDVLLIDTPPGTGDIPLTLYQSFPIDAIVLVTTPQDLSALIVEKAKRLADKLGIDILGLVENMSAFVCPTCGARHALFGPEDSGERSAARLGVPLLEKLPLDPGLNRLLDGGRLEETASEGLTRTAALIREKMGKLCGPEMRPTGKA